MEKVEYGNDGKLTITRDGQRISGDDLSFVSGSDWGIVQSTYQNQGAVLYSSQWTGDWVPADFCGGGPGDLGGSRFSISNLRVSGSVVQGPEPQKCSGPQPGPAPGPAPGCDCSWTAGGSQCGDDDGSFCWRECCWSPLHRPRADCGSPIQLPANMTL